MTSDDGYPDDWNSRRKRVYKRDNYQCQKCGSSSGELHAHHIKPKSKGGSHDTSNLKTLCKNCHESVHGHSIGGGGGSRSYTENSTEGFLGWLLFFFLTGVIGVIVQGLSLNGIASLLPVPTAAVISVAAFSKMKHGDLRSLPYLFLLFGAFILLITVNWLLTNLGFVMTGFVFIYIVVVSIQSLSILDYFLSESVGIDGYPENGPAWPQYIVTALFSPVVGWALISPFVYQPLSGYFLYLAAIVLPALTVCLVYTSRFFTQASIGTREFGGVLCMLTLKLVAALVIFDSTLSDVESTAEIIFGSLLIGSVALSITWVVVSSRYPTIVSSKSEPSSDNI